MTDLKSGILFEDTNQFLPWGTSLHKLVTNTESKIRKESDRIIIDWGEHQLLNGLKLHLTTTYLTPIIPLFLRKFKTIESEITGDTAAKLGFEKIATHLKNLLNEPSYVLINADNEQYLEWNPDGVKIALHLFEQHTNKLSFTISQN